MPMIDVYARDGTFKDKKKLILDLTAEAKSEIPGWSQEELPV